ncbi:MAG: hypothetical protein ACXAEN_26510 [Candidatus Thorarchaeota archaeon]
MTDLDCVEYCYRCKEPIALIEIAQDVGQEKKWTTPMLKLAARANLPAYLIFYTGNHQTDKDAQILSVRLQQIYPLKYNEIALTGDQYHLFLILLRTKRHDFCYESVDFDFWGIKPTEDDLAIMQQIFE